MKVLSRSPVPSILDAPGFRHGEEYNGCPQAGTRYSSIPLRGAVLSERLNLARKGLVTEYSAVLAPLDKGIRRFGVKSTASNPVSLFNP